MVYNVLIPPQYLSAEYNTHLASIVLQLANSLLKWRLLTLRKRRNEKTPTRGVANQPKKQDTTTVSITFFRTQAPFEV